MTCLATCRFRLLRAMTFVGGLKISLLPMACVFLKKIRISSFIRMHLFTVGVSCVTGSVQGGPWAGSDRLPHINELELLTAFYALKSLTAQSANLEINLILDNSTAVSYMNKRGGTRSRALCDISSSIVSWCESHNLSLTATHLPGILNSVADEQSRTSLDASDWMLCRSTFRKLSAVWKTEVDSFANKWNAQLPTFVLWMVQPDAFALNAFSLNWSRFKGYAFPPFALIV